MRRDFLLFASAFFLFLLPQLVRMSSGEPGIIGYPTYRLARVSELAVSGSFYDPLSYQGSFAVYPPGYFLVLGTMSVSMQLDVYAVASFLGPLMGAFSVLLLSKVYSRRTMLVFLLVPITVYLFSHAGSRTVPFLFGSAALFLYKRSRPMTSSLLLSAASLTHPEVSAVFLVLIVIDSVFKDRRLSRRFSDIIYPVAAFALPVVAMLAVFGLPSPNPLHIDYSTPAKASLHPSSFDELVSIFNNPYAALSLPVLVLLLFSARDFDTKNLTFLALALAASILFQRLRIYLGLAAALFASKQVEKLKPAPLMLLVLISIPYLCQEVVWMSQKGPTKCFLSLVPESGTSDDTIISNWAYGHWVESLANKKSFMDGSAEYVPDAGKRLSDFTAIYTFGNSTSFQLLESNSIDYVLVMESDAEYFASRGMELRVEELNLTTAKNATCGTLYRT